MSKSKLMGPFAYFNRGTQPSKNTVGFFLDSCYTQPDHQEQVRYPPIIRLGPPRLSLKSLWVQYAIDSLEGPPDEIVFLFQTEVQKRFLTVTGSDAPVSLW